MVALRELPGVVPGPFGGEAMKLVRCYWRTDRICPHPTLCRYGYECVARPQDRARRLARLNSPAHRSYQPRTFDQVAPMTAAMDAEIAEEIAQQERDTVDEWGEEATRCQQCNAPIYPTKTLCAACEYPDIGE
jgi:hypothetical protein